MAGDPFPGPLQGSLFPSPWYDPTAAGQPIVGHVAFTPTVPALSDADVARIVDAVVERLRAEREAEMRTLLEALR